EAFRAGMHVGRENAQVPQYADSPPRRHRQEERYTGRATPGDSRSRISRGHTVVVNQFPASNARNVSIDATDDPETLPQTYRVIIPSSESFESSSDGDIPQNTDQYCQHRPNKSSPRDRNVSDGSEDTGNVIQNVEPLVRKIVKDIVKDVVERLPGEKANSKQDGKPNFHCNHEPEDDDIDGEPMAVKSMPGAYPPSTSKVIIRYRSGTRDTLPASSSRKATDQSESEVPLNLNYW